MNIYDTNVYYKFTNFGILIIKSILFTLYMWVLIIQ